MNAANMPPDPAILDLRFRQMRNMLATLLLSRKTPMLLASDEFARTQNEDNNAYRQGQRDFLGRLALDRRPSVGAGALHPTPHGDPPCASDVAAGLVSLWSAGEELSVKDVAWLTLPATN
jgi:hypothetical protein